MIVYYYPYIVKGPISGAGLNVVSALFAASYDDHGGRYQGAGSRLALDVDLIILVEWRRKQDQGTRNAAFSFDNLQLVSSFAVRPAAMAHRPRVQAGATGTV